MKTKVFLLTVVFVMNMVCTNAQIQIHQGGNISIGSTLAPPSGFKMQLIGHSVFSANSGSITSSAFIRGLNTFSTVTTPDYTWWGSDQTGIFHPSGSEVGISSEGTERFRFYNGGINCYGNATFSATLGNIQSAAFIRGNNNYSTALNPDFT